MRALQMGYSLQGFALASKAGFFKSLLSKALSGVVAMTLGAAFISSADAAVYTRFDSTTALNDWSIIQNGTPTLNQEVAIVNRPYGEGEPVLRITRPSGGSTANNAFIRYAGSAEGVVDGKIADFEMTSTISMTFLSGPSGSTDSTIGFLVRATAASYNSSKGYYVAFSPAEGGLLRLFDSPTSHSRGPADKPSGNGTELAAVALNLSSNVNYLFKVSAIGSTISASVWSEDGSTLLGELEYANARTGAGYFGIRSGFGNTGVSAYIKDVSFTVIPEPATVGFTLVGGTAMLMMLRRRSR